MSQTANKQGEIYSMILGCQKKNGNSYKMLYQHFYSYAMSVCIRYSGSFEEATEMLNNGFIKVFTKINLYDPSKPFKCWLCNIMINTAVESYLKNHLSHNNEKAEKPEELFKEGHTIDQLSYHEILTLAQQLSPIYRIVFNMYVIDGYTHKEIADKLNISVDASESSLIKARVNLKKMVRQLDESECLSFP